ncbi:unnamed protein product [Protopolystoma xenopodis]|uniref:Uncharacterized protein n=1 Tax=Protopolystoma xenopodis TaxID=117903 RepID=A0A3S5FD92_9PLAT|nr:unnamed protein product [Protopolystoma xenopodis]
MKVAQRVGYTGRTEGNDTSSGKAKAVMIDGIMHNLDTHPPKAAAQVAQFPETRQKKWFQISLTLKQPILPISAILVEGSTTNGSPRKTT